MRTTHKLQEGEELWHVVTVKNLGTTNQAARKHLFQSHLKQPDLLTTQTSLITQLMHLPEVVAEDPGVEEVQEEVEEVLEEVEEVQEEVAQANKAVW